MEKAQITKQKFTPFLWFDNQPEEAAHFYTSIFENSRIGPVTRYGESGSGLSKLCAPTAFFEVMSGFTGKRL